MRLTLRMLLDYLDDALDSKLTKKIGQRISESKSLQELLARLRQVTRTRKLTVPKSDSDHKHNDPNTVAAFLDNQLPAGSAEKLEKLYMQSDVNLAEIAACHQLLSILEGEPVRVPATSHQRMYQLVEGPESQPDREPVVQTQTESFPYNLSEESDNTLLLGLPALRKSNPRNQKILAAAVIFCLAGVLSIILYMATWGRDGAGIGQKGPESQAKKDKQPQPPKPPGKKPDDQLVFANWPGKLRQDSPIDVFPFVVMWSNVTLSSKGIGDSGADVSSIPEPPIKKPDKMPPTPVNPPDNQTVIIGKYSTLQPQESILLLKLEQDRWQFLKPQDPVQINQHLITLPAFRSELTLTNGIKMMMVGNIPEISNNRVLDCSITLRRAEEPDSKLIELELHRGRILLTKQKQGAVPIRLRFHGQIWDITLLEEKTQVGVELTSRLISGDRQGIPHTKLSMIVAGGKIELNDRTNDTSEQIDAGMLIIWSSRVAKNVVIPLPEPPEWMNPANMVDEKIKRVRAIIHNRFRQKLVNVPEDRQTDKITLAIEELLNENVPLLQRVAIYSYGSLQNLVPVIKVLGDEQRRDLRLTAINTIWHWLGQGNNQILKLQPLLEKEYSKEEVLILRVLLLGFSNGTAETADFLLGSLLHPKIAIRELALLNLNELYELPKNLQVDPAAPFNMRKMAVTELRKRIVTKP